MVQNGCVFAGYLCYYRYGDIDSNNKGLNDNVIIHKLALIKFIQSDKCEIMDLRHVGHLNICAINFYSIEIFFI